MDILKKLSLTEIPKLEIGDTILTLWGNNSIGRRWCEREPLRVTKLPESKNDFIELESSALISPIATLEFIGINEHGYNYWILKPEEVAQ
tara:strand:- start:1897 stop:2166 length:270 start_codon:yes stop_codon:yes gene_type:complete